MITKNNVFIRKNRAKTTFFSIFASILLTFGTTFIHSMVPKQTNSFQYDHHTRINGNNIGWLYISEHNDYVLINIGNNSSPEDGNFFYINPDVPKIELPNGLENILCKINVVMRVPLNSL